MKFGFKKMLAVMSAAALSFSALIAAVPVSAANEFAGYTWAATDGYMDASTTVDYSDNQLKIDFEGMDNNENMAGVCTNNGESINADWSAMDEIKFTAHNPNGFDVNLTFAMCTGTEWDWFQSGSFTIPANDKLDIELHLTTKYWAWEGSDWAYTVAPENLLYMQRINLALGSTDTTPRTGSITLSDWSISEGSGGTDEPGKITSDGGFFVNGNTLYDANNNPFVMRGVNYAFTWFKGSESNVIPKLAGLGCNTVRIVLANGQKWTKNTASEVANLIKLCEANKMVAVLEVHDATGNDDQNALIAAAQYFAELKDTLSGHEASVIINIANEWQGSTNGYSWANAYKAAIKVIRDAGLKHCIMADAGGWGQGASTIHQYATEVLAADSEKNTMFSIHMYGTAGGSASVIKTNIDGVLDKNLCLCIGEFGCNHTDGDVDEDYIMSYCEEKNVGWLAWSWSGNSQEVAYLDLVTSVDGATLTSWGETVFNGNLGTKKTSELCTVYTETIVDPPVVKYDVDKDGAFTINDIAKLVKCILGTAEMSSIDAKAADASGDENINVVDLSIILRAFIAMK